MKYLTRYQILGIVLVVLCNRSFSESPEAMASKVEAILLNSKEKHNLMLLGPAISDFTAKDLPLFANFLPTNLGYQAFHAMTELDAEASVPLFAQNLTNVNRNVQSKILKLFASHNNQDGFPRTQVHERIRQAIRNDSVPIRHALLALAAFDNVSDIPLIKSFRETQSDPVRWATARLGDEESLAEVIRRIVPPKPGSPEYENNRPWSEYMDELGKTEWIGRPELIPVLILNLNLRETRVFDSEFLYTSPSSVALQSLQNIVPVTDHPADSENPDAWVEWWSNNASREPSTSP